MGAHLRDRIILALKNCHGAVARAANRADPGSARWLDVGQLAFSASQLNASQDRRGTNQ